ncbi:hypothetical protein K3495_g8829 [Podosphaera aphanis]|nr:hypothetical protein K3495_g8829 [Podosphaera aphanis]
MSSDQRKDLSPGELFVKKAWPEAVFSDGIDDWAYTSIKNGVVLKPKWRLVEANSEVFSKLTRIKFALQMALVPYHLSGHKVAADMDGDFLNVRIWAAGKHVAWIPFLEAIFLTMQRLDVLHDPMTAFSRLRPMDSETAKAFVWRIRIAFYRLSGTDRVSDSIRAIMKDIVSTHLPRIWTLAHPHTLKCNNYEIVEMIVQLTSQVNKWPNEDRMFSYHNFNNSTMTTPLSLELPAFDAMGPSAEKHTDDPTFIANDNDCYTCGKTGHWAKNCNKSLPQSSHLFTKRDQKPPSVNYDQLRRKIGKIRNFAKQTPKYKQNFYLTNNDNEESSDPTTIISEENIDNELPKLIDELEQVVSED